MPAGAHSDGIDVCMAYADADDAMSRASDPDSDEMETETEVTEATPLVAAGNFWAKQPKQPQEGYSSVARTEVMLTAHGYTS